MKPKAKIESIKCPFCQKRYMIQKSRTYQIKSIFGEKEWYCLSCPVWVWSDYWFDEFTQFEHLIKREGDYT